MEPIPGEQDLSENPGCFDQRKLPELVRFVIAGIIWGRRRSAYWMTDETLAGVMRNLGFGITDEGTLVDLVFKKSEKE